DKNGLATADLNADGLDDLIVTHRDQPAQIYVQARDGTFRLHTTLGSASIGATGLATGDLDGDGDLDLMLGQHDDFVYPPQPRSGPNQIYLNQGDGRFGPALPFGAATEDTVSLALADLDNDGNLDMVVGNGGSFSMAPAQPSFIYWNRGNWAIPNAEHFGVTPLSAVSGHSAQVVVGDFNGDGFTDLVVGDAQKSESIFLNHGDRTFSQQWLTPSGAQADGLFALDLDLDGDLDLLAGSNGAALRNDGHGVFSWYQEFPEVLKIEGEINFDSIVGIGDLNGDGLTDGIAVRSSPQPPYRSCLAVQTRYTAHLQPPPPAKIKLLPLDKTVLDGPYASPQIFAAGAITFTYTLFDPTARPADVRGFYSLDGGGKWYTATATAATTLNGLATLAGNQPITYTYTWDVLGSGFFGQSDRVVFRLETRPDLHPQRNSVPGPYRRPYAAAQSYPFRVRGNQVRVVDPAGKPMADALVYQLRANRGGMAEPLAATSGGAPFRTNSQGYLSGRAALAVGAQLVALAPISATQTFTLYASSAIPNPTGLTMTQVTASGVQTLTVSSANPLLLFNLDISLEWDARQDIQFLAQLQFDIGRASQFLYDWTNGRAALGDVTIYQNREHWEAADVQLYATNRLRPNAAQGGIVTTEISETVGPPAVPRAQTINYAPGLIRMGAQWNRYGEPSSGAQSEDWERAFAHELGHYLFYLDDNYLGFQGDQLIPVASCTGSAMTDPYREDYTEFLFATEWGSGCAKTMAAQTTGRADWATITHFYPALASASANPGPNNLALAVTQLRFVEPPTATTPLAAPIFYLTEQG
ncbi:MAG: VCBS repeat-containing protein, partial [Chloroflexi bacterium]|nr:VCBS repeat-containing protein [Chloroflexota bacterium]